jgi:hypothetical protein
MDHPQSGLLGQPSEPVWEQLRPYRLAQRVYQHQPRILGTPGKPEQACQRPDGPSESGGALTCLSWISSTGTDL